MGILSSAWQVVGGDRINHASTLLNKTVGRAFTFVVLCPKTKQLFLHVAVGWSASCIQLAPPYLFSLHTGCFSLIIQQVD